MKYALPIADIQLIAFQANDQICGICSNRSAALLKLNKVQKALADAEQCIELRKDWEKGYFRKAVILETLKKYDQVLNPCQRQCLFLL